MVKWDIAMHEKADMQGIGMTSQRTRERLVARLRAEGIQHEGLLAAIGRLPRHLFVDEALAHHAYEDVSLPISYSQTISQPYIVARMTELLLDIAPLHKVLEIGTGSGYQTALLAQFADEVHSVERIQPLLMAARKRLRSLDLLKKVHLHYADGFNGWPEAAPYQGILVTAAPIEIPSMLLSQLADGGHLIVPIGEREEQVLTLVTRKGTYYDSVALEPVRFVPLLSGKE
jgi:protein-L-isoaspartate(D-aspartate) O-methyltransferase